jgi:hypothetical protein
MAGAMLFGLQHKRQPIIGHRLRHRLSAKPIHHASLARTECMRGIHHVAEQGFARQFM